jgi:hypothetical protein
MPPYRRQPMVVPAGRVAHGIVGPPAGWGPFVDAWLNRPTQTPEPDKGASGRARRGMTDVGRIGWLRPQRAFDHEPAGPLRQAVLAEPHALAGTLVHDRPLGPCRDAPPRPTRGRATRRHGRHGARGRVGDHSPLRAHCPLLAVALRRGPRRLEPAAGVRRNRHACRAPATRVHGVQEVGAMALEALRPHRLARQEPRLRHGRHHRRRPRRLALPAPLVGDRARGPAGGRRVGKPRRRQQALGHEGIPRA